MTLSLLDSDFDGLSCAVLMDGRRLFDLATDLPARVPLYQSVWRVRIDRIIPKIGAFASLGETGTGLLKDFKGRSGDTVIVQVKSVRGEDKAHILTSDIALAGRLFIYLPLSPGIKMPRQGGRTPETLHTDLAAAGIEGGIVRTAAAKADPAEIMVEANLLRRRWMAAQGQGGLLIPGPDAATRLALDYSEQPIVHSAGDCDAALLEALSVPWIDLGQGASLIIERTSALTAIDVNSGQRSPADINMIAAAEAARQIRLRNLSGLIVIDFAAPGPRPGNALFKAVERALLPDPARPRIMGVTPAGLLEITRPRRTPPLEEALKMVQDTV